MQESGEMYLETIYVLQKRYKEVRSIDIARELNLARASVSRAVGILKKNGLVVMCENGILVLTEQGEKKASEIYERHIIIKNFLMKTLQVADTVAEIDACRIEHILSEETFIKMKEYLNK